MTPDQAIIEALRLSGLSRIELSRRLGHRSDKTVRQWCKGRGYRMETFCRVLDLCGVSGGYDDARGWWVMRQEDVGPALVDIRDVLRSPDEK